MSALEKQLVGTRAHSEQLVAGTAIAVVAGVIALLASAS